MELCGPPSAVSAVCRLFGMPRAVRFDSYGHRDVLYIAEVPMPEPGPGEVVVAMRAAGINPGEASIREGYMHERYPATFPSGEHAT